MICIARGAMTYKVSVHPEAGVSHLRHLRDRRRDCVAIDFEARLFFRLVLMRQLRALWYSRVCVGCGRLRRIDATIAAAQNEAKSWRMLSGREFRDTTRNAS